jgi:hypothetical protein
VLDAATLSKTSPRIITLSLTPLSRTYIATNFIMLSVACFIDILGVVMLRVANADCHGAGLKKVYKIVGRRKSTKDLTPRVNFAPAPSSTDPSRFTFIFDLFKSGNGLVVPLEEIIEIEYKLESEFYRRKRLVCCIGRARKDFLLG